MKKTIQIFTLIFVTAALFPVLSGSDSYLASGAVFPIPLKWPSLMLLTSIFIPVLIQNLRETGGRDLIRAYRHTALITIPLCFLGIVSMIYGMHPTAFWGHGARHILIISYDWVLLLLSIAIANTELIRKHHRTMFFLIFSAMAFVTCLDTVSPGMFSVQDARGAGFGMNPNRGAMNILFMAIATINWEKGDLLDFLTFLIGALALLATMSFGVIIVYLLVFIYYLILINWFTGKKLQKAASFFIVLFLMIFFVKPWLIEYTETNKMFTQHNAKKRIADVVNLAHGDSSFVTNHSRMELLKNFWALIGDSPIIGYGTHFAASFPQQPHNMFLKLWLEFGLLGFLLYLAFLWGTLWHFVRLKDSRGTIFILAALAMSFYTHNLLFMRTFIVLLGILGTQAYLKSLGGSFKSDVRNEG